MGKKRFLISLGLGIGVWVVSGIVQALYNRGAFGSYIFGASCELTGYPIARCIPDYNKGEIFLTYLINILFWFGVVNLLWAVFKKADK